MILKSKSQILRNEIKWKILGFVMNERVLLKRLKHKAKER